MHALSGKFPEHTLHSQAAAVSRYRARCYWEKSICVLMNPDRCQNATRKSRGPLLLRYTSVGKHRVSVNCNKIKLEESYLLFVLCEVAKRCDEHVFLERLREYRCLNRKYRCKKQIILYCQLFRREEIGYQKQKQYSRIFFFIISYLF